MLSEISDANDRTFCIQVYRNDTGTNPPNYEFDAIVPKGQPRVIKPPTSSIETQYFYCDFGGKPERKKKKGKKDKGKKGTKGKTGKKGKKTKKSKNK